MSPQIGLVPTYEPDVTGEPLMVKPSTAFAGLVACSAGAPVVNEAVAVFDGRTQDRIRDNILAAAQGRGVLWIANRPAQAEPFEQIVVMQAGKVAAKGTPKELAARGGLYAELMASA